MILFVGLKHIKHVPSVEASETELDFSGSDDCHSFYTCNPIPKVHPKKSIIFSATDLCYIAEENFNGPKKDFWRGRHSD